MIRAFVLMGAAADEALQPEDPPDGPPTNVVGYLYGGNLYGVQWTNGDNVSVQVGYSPTVGVEPVLGSGETVQTLPPGTTNYETGEVFSEGTYDAYGSWWVRHVTTGGASAWVEWDFTP